MIEWALDSYWVTSSKWGKVMSISIVPFNYFGIVVVEEFFAVLYSHYPHEYCTFLSHIPQKSGVYFKVGWLLNFIKIFL